LNIAVFPNNEIRLRIPSVATTKRSERGSVFVGASPPSYLSIAEKLRLDSPEALKPKSVRIGMAPGYGGRPKGTEFSRRGRRLMVRAGALLGSGGYGSNNLFLTGTLPGSTDEAMSSLAEWSSWTVHELLTRLPRLAQVPASECRWIWCWEYQSRGALHWHCVLKLPDYQSRDRVIQGFTSVWNSVLIGVSKKSGVDIFARAAGGTWKDEPQAWISSAEILRKRADRYLAKYLSKQAGKDASKFFPPTRWYGLNRALHNEYKASVIRYETHTNNDVRHETTELDVGIIESLRATASSFFSYPDKVGTGINFVAYFDDEEFTFLRQDLDTKMKELDAMTQAQYAPRFTKYYAALEAIRKRPHCLERLLNDVGAHYRKCYDDYVNCSEELMEEDVFWLDYYAQNILHTQGLNYEGQPPKRSEVGLPTPSSLQLKPTPPRGCFDQPSLFP